MTHSPNASAIKWEIEQEFPLEPTTPQYEVGDIFRDYGPAYIEAHPLNTVYAGIIKAISNCRTNALGAHVDQCDQCGHIEISYNSCRTYYCPKCQGSQRFKWVNARELELLPIQYFHFVFTLPHQLLPLLRYNEKKMYGLLMQISALTLQTFAKKKWDAQLGIIMALHTWGQTLNQHPHVHCIVTGGALKKDQSEFIHAPKNYLFSVQALSKVYREKYLAALKVALQAGELNLPDNVIDKKNNWQSFISTLYQHDWVVYAKQTCAKPEHLIRYVGRYINRVAISNSRILDIGDGHIHFKYHDNRDDKDKVMELPAQEFIRRFLTHVLPRGFRRIRYYGFFVNSQRKKKLILCRQLLDIPHPEKPYIADMDHLLTCLGYDVDLCPHCGQGKMKTIDVIAPFHDPPQRYLEAE